MTLAECVYCRIKWNARERGRQEKKLQAFTFTYFTLRGEREIERGPSADCQILRQGKDAFDETNKCSRKGERKREREQKSKLQFRVTQEMVKFFNFKLSVESTGHTFITDDFRPVTRVTDELLMLLSVCMYLCRRCCWWCTYKPDPRKCLYEVDWGEVTCSSCPREPAGGERWRQTRERERKRKRGRERERKKEMSNEKFHWPRKRERVEFVLNVWIMSLESIDMPLVMCLLHWFVVQRVLAGQRTSAERATRRPWYSRG